MNLLTVWLQGVRKRGCLSNWVNGGAMCGNGKH